MNRKRIVIAGGSGFIGTALVREFSARNYEVVILTRLPRERSDGVREAEWDGEHIGEWIQFLDGAEAVINLAGRTVHCIHSPENLRQINESRVNSVRAIAGAFEHIGHLPRVWVQASGIGFYGDCGSRRCDETTPNGTNHLALICRNWEGAFNSADTKNSRRVILRIGMVLGLGGGGFPVMAKLTKYFLGGSAGNGGQYLSWIHLADLERMFVAAVENDNLLGIFNAVAPNPLTNAEFMDELRRALHRPWSPPVPEFAVRIGARLMKTEPSFALESCRCTPEKFLAVGFQFQFSNLRAALENLCR
jgi:uncharacterized protein (TIGR01777 family)